MKILDANPSCSSSPHYWNHSLFYASKTDTHTVGESLEFNPSVDGVLGDTAYYKQLYERVFQVRDTAQ